MKHALPISEANLLAAVAEAEGPDAEAAAAAAARNAVLTKPAGALGRLEDLAQFCAGWRGRGDISRLSAHAVVFAGDHGVAARGVSPYPSSVTAQMVANFEAGGAAINQLCRIAGAELSVRALDVGRPTADFTEGPAMTPDAFAAALGAGWAAVGSGTDVVLFGEMGIGNTTSAAAVAAALNGGDADDWVGPGAGAVGETLARKRAVVDAGLALHRPALAGEGRGLEALRRLGGREMAAIAGALARARVERSIVLLDGAIVTAAASALIADAPKARDVCLAAHRSAEPAHDRLLQALDLDPILDLGLRLGEGSGAALALNILNAAVACHGGMATFADAGVDGPA